MIPVRKMLVPKEKHALKCPYPMTAEFICVHNTYNDASANNEIKYMISNNNATSYHYAIDDFEVVQGIEETKNGFHAGDGGKGAGNRKSIGIEICYSKSGGERYKKAEKLAVQFIAQLLHQKKWTIAKVKKHQDFSGKYCPHRILDEKRWQLFLNDITNELTKLVQNPAKTEIKKETPAKTDTPIGTVKVLVNNLNYYNGARWTKPSGTAKKNTVFTVMEKVKVEDGYQYRLKSGNFITASTKYVVFTKK